MEPLFATLVAIIFFHDVITPGMMLGGGLMITATALPELYDLLAQRWMARRTQEMREVPSSAAHLVASNADISAPCSARPALVRPVLVASQSLVRPALVGFKREVLNPHLLGVRFGR